MIAMSPHTIMDCDDTTGLRVPTVCEAPLNLSAVQVAPGRLGHHRLSWGAVLGQVLHALQGPPAAVLC